MLLTFDTNPQINELHLDLKAFGLNPSEWLILKDREEVYKVKSRIDDNFMFQGKAEKKGQSHKWERLELVSI